MNIQIYGRNKCFDTKKAERYFQERKIKFQSIDIDRFGLSKGELSAVKASVGISSLINNKSNEYKALNIQMIRSSETKEELLLNHPKLYNTPIVRNGRQATAGYQPDIWKSWE